MSLVCAAADRNAVLGQFDPTKRHLPFMGEGSCDAPVELENGYISVHCLGPKQTLAPGEVRWQRPRWCLCCRTCEAADVVATSGM